MQKTKKLLRRALMKILVVGGAGYVGGVIVDLLLKNKKYDVTVYDNLLYEESYRKDCKLSLADAFSNYLKEKEKLRKCTILCQRFSRDTVGDAIFSYLFLEHLNRKFYKSSKIIVISSQYHIKRVEYIFTRIFNLKINFIGVPDKKFNYPLVDKLKNSEERSLNEFKESFDDVESGNIFLFYKKLREIHPLYNGEIHQKIPDLKATLNNIKKSINIK